MKGIQCIFEVVTDFLLSPSSLAMSRRLYTFRNRALEGFVLLRPFVVYTVNVCLLLFDEMSRVIEQ